MNGKPAWISTNQQNALYFSDDIGKWIFGSASSIGSGSSGIFANGDADCPQDVSSWIAYTNGGWLEISASDFSFECYVIGTVVEKTNWPHTIYRYKMAFFRGRGPY